MRRVLSVIHRLGQVINQIVEAHIPMSFWLDSTTLRLYKTRL
jgi:hypothetical protein